MSEPLQREWRFYVSVMIGFAEKVLALKKAADENRIR